MIVLLDQDNVLADFEEGFRVAWRERFPEIPPLGPQQRKSFSLKLDYPPEQHEMVQSTYCSRGFFRNLPPVLGALEGVRGLIDAGVEVFICTAPLRHFEHCVLEKFEWVEQHLGRRFCERMILSRDKTLVDGDVLVDDNPRIHGVRTPRWRHVVYDQPFNRQLNGVSRMTWENWREVLL
jgi:5'-nucleotidase